MLPENSRPTDKKGAYFGALFLRNWHAFQLHKREGLWIKVDSGKRDWGNMSEHCAVVAARAGTVARMLGLSPKTERELEQAGSLHDLSKKRQKITVTGAGLSYESFDKAAEESESLLLSLGIGKEIVEIAGSCGHEALLGTINPTLKIPVNQMSELDKAKLVMFYVDTYSMGSGWVTPASTLDGQGENDLDRRIASNEKNPRYTTLNEAGRIHFDGKTSYQAQLSAGKQVQSLITYLINQRTGGNTYPINLPEEIDKRIKDEISAL